MLVTSVGRVGEGRLKSAHQGDVYKALFWFCAALVCDRVVSLMPTFTFTAILGVWLVKTLEMQKNQLGEC